MTSVVIPDSLPPLVRGIGRHPASGGCLMQVTNYIATGAWTDGSARNVYPVLQRAAILTNDGVCDKHRKELWQFVPRLMATFNFNCRIRNDDSFEHMAASLFFQSQHTTCDHCLDLLTVAAGVGCTCCHRCKRLIEALSELITRFDMISRRPQTSAPVNWSKVKSRFIGDADLRVISSSGGNMCGDPDCSMCPSFITLTPAVVSVDVNTMTTKLMMIADAATQITESAKDVVVAMAQATESMAGIVDWSSIDTSMSSKVIIGIDPPVVASITVADVDMFVGA